MEINNKSNPLYYVYLGGFWVILALPVLISPFLFFPPDWGKSVVFRSILAILLFLFFWQFLFKNARIDFSSLKKNKVVWLLIGFWGANLISTLFSADPYFSLWGGPERAGGLVNLTFFIIFALAMFLLIKKGSRSQSDRGSPIESGQWQKVWDFSLWIGVIVSAIAIIQQFGLWKIFTTAESRMPSTMGNTILLAIYLMMLFFIAFSFLIKEFQKTGSFTSFGLKKIFYSSSLLLFLWVIISTGSRAAWIGLAVGFLYFIIFYPVRNYTRDDKPTEQIVSNGASPKKIRLIKLSVITLLSLVILFVYVINTNPNIYQSLSENKITGQVVSRLSFDLLLQDPRVSVWQISFGAFKEKPILGWGPENFDIAFDEYYDPSLPYIDKNWGSWYDRAHSFFFELLVTTGVLGLLSYLSLVGLVFWKLHKLKTQISTDENTEQHRIIAHGIMAVFIAYLVANFFSFDSFSSYLLFFLLIAWSMHIISSKNNRDDKYAASPTHLVSNTPPVWNVQLLKYKKPAMVIVFALAVFFLWQYNLKPLYLNRQINFAKAISTTQCQQAVEIMDKSLKKDSILNNYLRMQYGFLLERCLSLQPEENLDYIKKGIAALQEKSKIREKYTRLWILLGSFQNALVVKTQDPVKKAELASQANYYFERAVELSPKKQEIFIEWSKLYMALNNFEKVKEKAILCRDISSNISDCYFYWALAEISMGNVKEGKTILKEEEKRRVQPLTAAGYYQLIRAYELNKNYEESAQTYQELIRKRLENNKPVAQDHASFAFVLAKLGRYKEAREQALIFLEMMPEARSEVILFLQTLQPPYNTLP